MLRPFMGSLRRFVDSFTIALVLTVLLATLAPCRGEVASAFEVITSGAIALLFFLHGAKLSREAIVAGATHWRLHALVFFGTFVLFPILGLLLKPLSPVLLTPELYLGRLVSLRVAFDGSIVHRVYVDSGWECPGGDLQRIGLERVCGLSDADPCQFIYRWDGTLACRCPAPSGRSCCRFLFLLWLVIWLGLGSVSGWSTAGG